MNIFKNREPLIFEYEVRLRRASKVIVSRLTHALKMVDFNNAISITDNFVPILLSFYIGSWSDKFGRKPFIALFMLGKLVALLGTLLGGVFLEEMGKWAWLGLVTPINCLAGGVSTFVLVTYSFAADNSSPRSGDLKIMGSER